MERKLTAHIHAAGMALYAQDAAETDRPWERWEMQTREGIWLSMDRNPVWDLCATYRRKPRTIRIGEYDVPEPLREAPLVGAMVWMVHTNVEDMFWKAMWDGSDVYVRLLARGMLHATREAAELHAKALLSFTEQPHA